MKPKTITVIKVETKCVGEKIIPLPSDVEIISDYLVNRITEENAKIEACNNEARSNE